MEKDSEIIKFRPHHFMCTVGFKGKGYSLGFIKNYKKIVARLNSNEDTLIQVVENMDSICSPCPNKIDDVLCKHQEKINNLDNSHAKALKLKIGEVMSWKDAKKRIKKHMTIEKFNQACSGCQWKKYGVCEQSLKEL